MVNRQNSQSVNIQLTKKYDPANATRMSNLGLILRRVPAIDVAQAIGKTPAMVSMKKNGKRNITDETARKIETHFGLEDGWMDEHHFEELPANFGTQGSQGLPLRATIPKDVAMEGRVDDVADKERMALKIREAVQRLDYRTALHVGATFLVDEMTDDQRRLFTQWLGSRYHLQTGVPLEARRLLTDD